MIELTGQCLVVLAVLEATLRWRWAARVAGAVLAVAAAWRAIETGAWPFAVATLLVAGSVLPGALAPPGAPGRMTTRSLVIAGCWIAASVPVLMGLPSLSEMNVLMGVLPVAAAGLALVCLGDPVGGTGLVMRAAVFAALMAPVAGGVAGLAALPLGLLLLALEASRIGAVRDRVTRCPGWVLMAVAGAGLVLAVAAVELAAPQTVAVAALSVTGMAVAGVTVHRSGGRRAPVNVAALAIAALGAGMAGLGPDGWAASLVVAGLGWHAAGLVRVARTRAPVSLLAVLVMDVSIWSVHRSAPGLLVPAGLAAASWAAILLADRPSWHRAIAHAPIAHGGVALAAFGLGAPGLYAGVLHMAGHLLAQAGLLFFPRVSRPAFLGLACLPPSALFVSSYLILRASGTALWPIAAVLALVAASFLHAGTRIEAGRDAGPDWRPWTPLAASTLLGVLAWAAAP